VIGCPKRVVNPASATRPARWTTRATRTRVSACAGQVWPARSATRASRSITGFRRTVVNRALATRSGPCRCSATRTANVRWVSGARRGITIIIQQDIASPTLMRYQEMSVSEGSTGKRTAYDRRENPSVRCSFVNVRGALIIVRQCETTFVF